MGGPAKRHATYEDLCAVPEHLVAELIGGDLYTSPHPALPQVRASSSLGALLVEPFDIGRVGPGGWVILHGPELHLGRDVLVPDLAGWRRERMPKLPDAAAVELAPDWVCEVQSPATAALDRMRKMPIYLRVGVTHLWLIDPQVQMVDVFRSQDARWSLLVTLEGDTLARIEPFDAIELDLSLLWQR